MNKIASEPHNHENRTIMVRVAWRKFITARQFKQSCRTDALITRRLAVGSVLLGGSSSITQNSHRKDELPSGQS